MTYTAELILKDSDGKVVSKHELETAIVGKKKQYLATRAKASKVLSSWGGHYFYTANLKGLAPPAKKKTKKSKK